MRNETLTELQELASELVCAVDVLSILFYAVEEELVERRIVSNVLRSTHCQLTYLAESIQNLLEQNLK